MRKRRAPKIVRAVQQQVISADAGGEFAHQIGTGRFAVQPLLQVAEAFDMALFQHQQFAVQHAFEIERFQHIGEAFADIVAGAAVKAALACFMDGLDADAVPFPFGGVVWGFVFLEIAGRIQRLGQHHGTKATRRISAGFFAPARQPLEQIFIRRRLAVPQLFDIGQFHVTQLRQCLLGEAGGNADTQPPGQKLEQRPAAIGVQRIQPAFQQLGHFAARGAAQGVHHFGQFRLGIGARLAGPDQCHGFGQVADEIIGQREELGIEARLHHLADHRRFGGVERQIAGQAGQGPAALGIRRVPQIIAQQSELAVARGGEGEPVEQQGEGFHASSSS